MRNTIEYRTEEKRVHFVLTCLVLALILLFCWASSSWAGVHQVRVEEEVESEREELVNATKEERALSRALLEETQQLLADSIPQGRGEVVRTFLQDRAGEFVLTYSRQEYISEEEAAVESFEVQVNTESLKDYLKQWGTYYTSRGDWKYRLEVENGLEEEKELDWAELETMSGVRRDGDVEDPVLRLRPPQDSEGRWEARFISEEEETIHYGRDLQELWLDIWSDYFARSDVRQRAESKVEIRVSGWPTSTGIRHFHHEMGGWSRTLDRVELHSVAWASDGLSGEWTVYTLTPRDLRARLQDHVPSRGLELEEVNILEMGTGEGDDEGDSWF